MSHEGPTRTIERSKNNHHHNTKQQKASFPNNSLSPQQEIDNGEILQRQKEEKGPQG